MYMYNIYARVIVERTVYIVIQRSCKIVYGAHVGSYHRSLGRKAVDRLGAGRLLGG